VIAAPSNVIRRAAVVASRGAMILVHKGDPAEQKVLATFTITVERMRHYGNGPLGQL
jgi:hypothetical protein